MWFGGGEGVAFARGQGCRCSFSAVHYFGAILKGPKACTLIPRVPRAPASRAEAESLQKPSRSPAPELAAALPAVPMCSAALDLGGAPDGREQPGTGWTPVPGAASREIQSLPGAALPGQAEWLALRPPRPCCRAHPQHRDDEHVPLSRIPATLWGRGRD